VRIALVHPYPWPEVRRGAERYVEDLASYLVGAGYEVVVVTGSTTGGRVERRVDGVVVDRRRHLPVGPARRLGVGQVEAFGLPALVGILRARADVVHAMTPTAALAGVAARRPTLYTVLGHPERSELPRPAAARWLFTSAVRRSTATAVLSEASASALRAWSSTDPIVLPPGTDVAAFAASDGHRDPCPAGGRPTLLVSAALADPRKRVVLAVAAVAELLPERPGLRLALSGQGDPSALLAAASRFGPEVRQAIDVLGPGRPEDVARRYHAATVTVLPSAHEAFGLALVESLACGTPVACTPDGGMPEIVTSAVGAVAATASGPALADAVRRALALAEEPGTADACRARARRWDWSAVGPRHEAVYRQLVS
jgi:glycosyltransferase involved in cell wall biosynthesis